MPTGDFVSGMAQTTGLRSVTTRQTGVVISEQATTVEVLVSNGVALNRVFLERGSVQTIGGPGSIETRSFMETTAGQRAGASMNNRGLADARNAITSASTLSRARAGVARATAPRAASSASGGSTGSS